MAQNGKVLAFGSRARDPLSRQQSASVLKDCRELALERMAKALSGMLDRVEDELFALADKALDRETQNVYLDARSAARGKRAAIESTFRRHFVDLFDRKVRGEADAQGPRRDPDELALVADEDLAERLAVSEMSHKLADACEPELFALRQRMGFLLERPELDDDANPVSPAAICAALKGACDQVESGYKVRMALLRQLERHTEAELQRVYHDLNAHLVSARVLPEVRAVARRSRAAGVPAARDGGDAGASGALFDTLARLLGAAQAAAPAPGAVGSADAGSADGGSDATAAIAVSPFMGELTRLHRHAMPARGEHARVNVLRELKSAPQGAALAPVDKMTIDIVAMLFDYVFEDGQIPASVKALLGRLQIPALKVALLDKSFFSSRAHPARRMLDLLARISIGIDDTDARGAATLALVGSVVEEVLERFETDIGLFESMVARIEAFAEQQGRVEADVVQRSVRVIEARERLEIGRLVAEEEVARRLLARVWLPAPVRVMLEGTWTRALTSVHLAEGEGTPVWQGLVATMDDLLWSVEPKSSPDDRKRLVAILPAMLRHIHQGYARAGDGECDRDAFLGALVDCHAAAVKAGLRALAVLPEPALAPPVQGEARIEREILPGIQVEEVRLRKPKGGIVRNVFTRTGIWTNLARDTWVEFARASKTPTRARLSWISPNKGVYLFTNPVCGAPAISISPEALAEQMRLGEARVIDGSALVDRAVDSMLQNLRKAG